MSDYVIAESEEIVFRALSERGFAVDDIIKLMVLGNGGVGKSFLANVLCGLDNLFRHEVSAQGVTTVNERVVIFLPNYPPILVYNIPGLMEALPQRVAANKVQIARAFREFPRAKLVGVYVFSGGLGGRVSSEQAAAFHSLLAFIGLHPDEASKHFTTVMNMIDTSGMSVLRRQTYEGEACYVVNCLLGTSEGATRIPLTVLSSLAPADKELGSLAREEMKEQLQCALASLIRTATPLVDPIPDDREIVLEGERLVNTIKHMEIHHEESIKAIELQHGAAMRQINDHVAQLQQQVAKKQKRSWIEIILGL